MISVIITTKNGGRFLSKSVASVLMQTNADFELLIVSDGSTDDTAEVAHNLAASDSLSRVLVIELKDNIGPGLARDMAIKKAKGEYIALLDDDDIWLSKNKLHNQTEYLNAHPDTVLVGASKVEFVRLRDKSAAGAADGSATGTGDPVHEFWLNQEKDSEKIRQNMLSYNPVITSSVMFRKGIYIKVGGFKPMYLAEDYDLWLRMGQIGKISNVDGADIAYTVRDNGATRMRRVEMAKIVTGLVNEYKNKYPGYLKAILKAYARVVLFSIKKILK